MTPTLRRTGLPDALTAREQDIARLAAGGLTSVQIAQSLAVATRTVENNLHRIYSKLGVPNRRALAGALRLPAVDP